MCNNELDVEQPRFLNLINIIIENSIGFVISEASLCGLRCSITLCMSFSVVFEQTQHKPNYGGYQIQNTITFIASRQVLVVD